MKLPEGLDRIGVALVGPQFGGNVGSVARVMMNLGFSNLNLVGRDLPLDEEAKKMAVRAWPLIERAPRMETLDGLSDRFDVLVGCTRRRGKGRTQIMDAGELPLQIGALDKEKRVALLFGPERIGLTNEEIERCHWTAALNVGAPNDSFNLSHAVALFLYEIRRSFHLLETAPNPAETRPRDLAPMFHAMDSAMERVSALAFSDPEPHKLRMRRILMRAGLSRADAAFLQKFFQFVEGLKQ